MGKALELLARASETGTPIGTCDICGETGPLKEIMGANKVKMFVCIPCVIDRELS